MPTLLVITGPIGAGKSTVAAGIGRRYQRADRYAAVVDLDDVTFMQHVRAPSLDAFWDRGRQAHAALVRAWFDLGAEAVVAHGPLVTSDELTHLLAALPPATDVWHLLLRVSYDAALHRVGQDDARRAEAMSRRPEFLRRTHDHFRTARPLGPPPHWEFDTETTTAADIADRVAGELLQRDPSPSAALDLELRTQSEGSGITCRAILDLLPTWFGVAEAVEEYVAEADRSPTIVASVCGRDAGILTLRHHNSFAAEVHLMAVVPELHRRGIGRTMLAEAERQLRLAGVEFLQVKTLSARHPDEGYAQTRAFYEACGFRPLEEFPELWDPQNPALQMVKAVIPGSVRSNRSSLESQP